MQRPTEGWILAGGPDGEARPAPQEDVCGLPHMLRLALTLMNAGVERVKVMWLGDGAAPELGDLARDERLCGMPLEVVVIAGPEPTPPTASAPVVLVRADRIYHRDIPRDLTRACDSGEDVIAVDGAEHDAVYVVSPALAGELVASARTPGSFPARLAALRDAGRISTIEPPYLGFTVAAPDRRALRRAEKLLVKSLRKAADGYCARYNRYVSLFLSRYLCKTGVRPNHVTVVCFLSALAGGVVIAQGGWANGVYGMLLLELGSVLDGVDGELSRLKWWGSKLGQWMDTVTDDFGNLFFTLGTSVALDHAGNPHALLIGVIAVTSFFLTQTSQYALIAWVYKSGDLAAIPWAFQAPPDLERIRKGETLVDRLKRGIPRFLKRDFFITLFLALALCNRLDIALYIFSGGAVSFFIAFVVQLLRWRFFGHKSSTRAA